MKVENSTVVTVIGSEIVIAMEIGLETGSETGSETGDTASIQIEA